MDPIETWLQAAGLAEHAPAFVAERITLDDLSSLTDSDLRELGLAMGERRRFRRAVLSREPDNASPATRTPITGERRPLTVMFVDVVGSTALADRIADEELLDLMRGFRELCGSAVGRTGGRIAKFLGDGILAYFCYPVAHENDPHRAVRAGLEIAAKAGLIRSRSGEALSVRVGIASGSVILGDLFDGGEPELLAATGSPLNLAARLQTCAPPGGVVIGDATHARIGHLFDCNDLGLFDLKGISTARCWLVRGEQGMAQSGALGPSLPVRGRDAELAVLKATWGHALDGQGSAVLIRGEAGVGKTAVINAFLRNAGLGPDAVITLAGSDLDRDTPFFPIRQVLRGLPASRTGFRPPPTPDGNQDETSALLAKLAGLPFDIAALAGLSPPQQRDRTLDAAALAVLHASRTGPLCVLAEDLHWFDPSSVEVLVRILERLAGRPVLLLMTARQAFDAPWSPASVPDLPIQPLRADDVRMMAMDLLGAVDLAQPLLKQIFDRTDGVPLFVQEIVRQIRQDFAGANDPAQDGATRAVPATLQEALMARLDQTGPAKEVAQAASTLGRRVERGLLGAVTDMAPAALDDCLVTLVDGGVLRPDGMGDDAWVFSHALLRDIAYNSLLREPRRVLHGRVADAILLEPGAGAEQPATLALHLTEAERFEPAARWWEEAARKALGASALLEATRLLRRGLDALAQAAPGTARTQLELEMLGLLGPALMTLKGHGADETRAHYDRAVDMCRALPDETSHFPLYWGWWRVATDYHTMRARASWLLCRARKHGDPGALLQAHHTNWASTYHMGEFSRSCEHIEAGLALYGSADWRNHLPLYGNHDAYACACCNLAMIHWMQGKPDGGAAHYERSRSWARGLRHLGSLLHNMDLGLVYNVMRRDHATAFRTAEELTAITAEHGFPDHGSKGKVYRGWIKALNDEPAAGLALLREGFAQQQDIGSSEDFPVFVCLLAETLIAAGRPDEAVAELLAARNQFDATGLRFWLPEVLRMTAAAMIATRSGADPAPVLADAAEVAEQQGVAMLGLRIAIDRAHLLMDWPDQAAPLLEQALAALPPQDTMDHATAKALLAAIKRGRPLFRAV